jgi:tetratricopeptide (TPR) repeat protein
MARLAFAIGLAFALGSTAHAQSADAIGRARTHFEAGRALYNLGNYTDAIREFSAGYQLVPKPQFLVNLGQAYRKLGDLGKAREMYKKFLDEAAPADPDREQVKGLLADIEAEQATQTPPTPAPAPAPATTSTTTSAPVVVSEAPQKKPFIKRHWWIIPVAAVVVGVAIGVGVYYGTRSNQVDCSSASLGCIDGSGIK